MDFFFFFYFNQLMIIAKINDAKYHVKLCSLAHGVIWVGVSWNMRQHSAKSVGT